ncbi:MAG: NADH-quinone oxidoreductase subunit A [Bacteroidia bacterium]|nr:NADH-quinone oxidoreductase subunit A [Bacteroidia bacterium]MDW8157516.1 NADH-quinone oxidoreductase subunit A [Bacteroidia bacterium]
MTEFGKILIYFIVGILFCIGGLIVSYLLNKTKNKKQELPPAQLTVYECGEESKGSAWIQFNPRFYTMGLIFIIFDVEILLLFPWSVSFENPVLKSHSWLLLSYIEGMMFIIVLVLGLLYLWYKDDICWIRPRATTISVPTNIPLDEYKKFNERY